MPFIAKGLFRNKQRNKTEGNLANPDSPAKLPSKHRWDGAKRLGQNRCGHYIQPTWFHLLTAKL